MDLERYLRVLWRFKYVTGAGLALATSLAVLTAATAHAAWESQATLLITQPGFPEGRSVFPQVFGAPAGHDSVTPTYADPSRFSGLALLYAQLAQGDAVRARMLQDGPVPGTVGAAPVMMPGSSTPLPLVVLTGQAGTATGADLTASRGVRAFLEYLSEEQRAAGISPRQRVVVDVVRRPTDAASVGGRKLTLPVIVFLAVVIATIAAAFGLENVRSVRASLVSVAAANQARPNRRRHGRV